MRSGLFGQPQRESERTKANMERFVRILTLFLLLTTACNAITVNTTADDTGRLLVLPLLPFYINCSLDEGDAPSVVLVSWYKSVEGGERQKLSSSERLKTAGASLLFLEPSAMLDPGNYTCSFAVQAADGQPPEATVQVIANVTVRLPGVSVSKNEGEDLFIHCTIRGRPWPTVHWTKDAQPIADAIADSSSRLTLRPDELGFPRALLALAGLRRPADAGDYCCHAESVANAASACTIVRVKGRHAALWPMLFTVVELLVLAAMIWLGEARRGRPAADGAEPEDSDDGLQPQGPMAGDARQRK